MQKKKSRKHKKSRKQNDILVVTITMIVTLAVVALLSLIIVNIKPESKIHDSNPVATHGRLSVQEKNIVDENGKVFQLRGVSTHGIGLDNFQNYVNQAAFNYMRDEWGINAVRLVLYTQESSGNNAASRAVVKQGVEYAKNAGLYAIIDWHVLLEGDPNIYKTQAIAYFQEMATLYKNYNNVIYEICNEPNGGGVTWNGSVKPYAEDVIKEIRKIDKKAIIAVGSSTWSQDLDRVAENPITGYSNLVYTMHFYAATHKDYLRNKLQIALNAGLPVLISEFGVCNADGNGDIDYDEASKWMDLLNANQIGFMIWQLSNKAEGASLIRSDVTKYTDWSYNELAAHGKWFVDTLNKY